MSRRADSRRWIAWLATLAVLLASLAPALTHAFGPGASAAQVEVCSAQGSRWITVGEVGRSDSPAPSLVHAFEHCASCLIHLDMTGLPPNPRADFLKVLDLRHALPIAFLTAPRTPHAWVTAQPRAPPLFS